MNILVTGACGQLGTELRILGAGSAHRLVFADLVSPEGTDTEILDICDRASVAALARSMEAEVIINCAAYNDVARAENDRDSAWKLNVSAVEGLAEVAKSLGALLVHISSDYVFDGKARRPYADDAPAAPLNVYGESKLAGERAVAQSGCRYLIFRTSWLYSPYGRNFLKTTLDITSTRPQMKVVNDQTGTPTYAADLAAMIFKAVEEAPHGEGRIYNFSNEGEVSWYGFAKAINELSGHDCEVLPCTSDEYPAGVRRPGYSVLDKSLVKKVFGVEIPDWETSLKACLERMSIL